jgi:hypothetical protein
VEETRVPGENHRPASSHSQTLSQNVVSSTPCLSGIQTHNFNVSLTPFPLLEIRDTGQPVVLAMIQFQPCCQFQFNTCTQILRQGYNGNHHLQIL